ncbi:ankyrin repeat domain-containing protein 16-like isoform X2 [Babylonia areolata]
MLACTKCRLPVISVLLKHGADPALLNKDGWNSFHIAAREGHVEILQTLLSPNPAIWNSVSHNGRTPLHTAALHGHLEAVRFLLNRCGYHSDACDSCGVTPLMDALRAGFVDVAALLISTHKAEVSRKDSLGRQALHHAAQAGQLAAVDFLVSTCKVPVDATTSDFSCITSLHLAAKEGQDAMIRLLIQKGADVNRADNKGRAALHIASAAQHASTVNLLLASGALDTLNSEGQLAQHLAVRQQVRQVFEKHRP